MNKREHLIKSLNCGLEFASCIVICVLLGIWIDKKLGCFPLFLVLLLPIGCVAGYLNMMKYIDRNS